MRSDPLPDLTRPDPLGALSNIQCTLNTLHNVTSLSQQSLTSQRNNITITHDYPNNNKIHVLRTLSN